MVLVQVILLHVLVLILLSILVLIGLLLVVMLIGSELLRLSLLLLLRHFMNGVLLLHIALRQNGGIVDHVVGELGVAGILGNGVFLCDLALANQLRS